MNKKIYKVELKTTNALKNTAEGKCGKYLEVQNSTIYIFEEDINYMIQNYEVLSIEYIGLFFKQKEE